MSETGDLFDLEDASYPLGPGFKRSLLGSATRIGDTSRAAAEQVKPNVKTIRADCHSYLKEHGPHTADETAAALGRDVLTVRPRFSELLRLQLIAPTSDRRPSSRNTLQRVWRAA
jgi:hypothetical protein